MFKRHAQLHEEELDVEALVRAELLEALQSPAIRQELIGALDVHATVFRALSEEKPRIMENLASSFDLPQQLSALVNDPRVMRQLASHIDLSTIISSTGLRDRLRESLASCDLVEYLERALPVVRQRMKRRLAEDAGLRASVALATGSWAIAGVICWLYVALATESCLVIIGWLMQLAFLRSTTFFWSLLTLPIHTARVYLAVRMAHVAPNMEDVITAMCTVQLVPNVCETVAASDTSALSTLLSPVVKRCGPLASLWIMCGVVDSLAMMVRVFAFGYGDESAAKVKLTHPT